MYQAKEVGRKEVEKVLINMWEKALKLDGINAGDNFFELGGDSIAAAVFTNLLQERLGEPVQITVIYEMPTVASLAEYLIANYHDSVAAIGGQNVIPIKEEITTHLTQRDFTYVRETITALNGYAAIGHTKSQSGSPKLKNPQAIFILCTARSGSTLLRIMLGGHRKLFSPPELLLLPYDSLRQRNATFSGPRSLWSEGIIRAIMDIKHCDAEQAKEVIAQCEERDLTIQEFYAFMQESLGGRRLVDKSPPYTQAIQVLRRAEDYFDNPLYIHLLRHPAAMVASYERERIDQLSFREHLGYEPRHMAELLWVMCHQNILEFLGNIPKERQFRVVFEDLVKRPRPVMESVCEFLSLDFDEEMLTPYQNQSKKMTNGTYPSSRMLGDPKFSTHKNIDAGVADSWKSIDRPVTLSEITWRFAEELGYERPKDR